MTCPWDPDPETTQDELERGWIDITRYLRSHTMTPYHDRLKKGEYAEPKATAAPDKAKKTATPTPKRTTRQKKKT